MDPLGRLLGRLPSTLALAGLAFLVASAPGAAQTGCQPAWRPTFGSQPGVDSWVYAMTVFDDGSGPALYAGGSFSTAGGVAAGYIAKCDGSNWTALGSGLSSSFGSGTVRALAVFDDGSGEALYAAGRFESAGAVALSNIAKWDGTSWSPLGSGLNEVVYALAVFDDGSGPALYAGGNFTLAGGAAAVRMAKWTGVTWSACGAGANGYVDALAVFDDGSGPALCAGGGFTNAGGVPASHLARWNGSSWSALGSGTNGNYVAALTVFDDGSGPALYAGGEFLSAGGVPTNHVARWDGSAWSALGGGANYIVSALAVFDDGGGRDLYAAGWFSAAGGVPANRIARWSGSSWSAVGAGVSGNAIQALAVYDDGSGPALCAGGSFTTAGGVVANNAAQWDGASWSSFGGGGVNDSVSALTVYDDALCAGGYFTFAGATGVQYIAEWDGASWSPLGSGMNGPVYALTVYDAGSGPRLIAGGAFGLAGGQLASRIAQWNGSSWAPMGSGMSGAKGAFVVALTVFDDGGGPKLYAGGNFPTAGGVVVNGVARWNGAAWSALGSGAESAVQALTVYDDGSGPALYAGGYFDNAGGVPASNIARWSGSSWSALGSGVGSATSGSVAALAVFDGGGGPALYAGGYFASAGGVPAASIASWDGSSWSALGSGVGGATYAWVSALSAFDDGHAPALYVGGSFPVAGGVPAGHIASWDGATWAPLGGGMSSAAVSALLPFDDGSGLALYAGGSFASAADSGDSFLAKWGNATGCGTPGLSVCEPGTGGVIACPCANPPAGGGLGCNNSSNTGGAQLSATGIARITYDTLRFTTSDEQPTATSIVLQGSALSPSGFDFGQGVRCVAGSLKRLYVQTAVGGSIHAPQGTDLPVHERSAALGDTIAPGTSRFYGVYYRDPSVLGGCPASSTFNITQQLDVLWAQ